MTGCDPAEFGGPEEIRTLDLRIANAALCQLSYQPKTGLQKLERERGIEPL